MFCPECRREFPADAVTCPDCGAILVEALAGDAESGDASDMVSILRTEDAGRMTLARSLLEAARIPYVARSDGRRDLFKYGRQDISSHGVVGGVTFLVPREDSASARILLADMLETAAGEA